MKTLIYLSKPVATGMIVFGIVIMLGTNITDAQNQRRRPSPAPAAKFKPAPNKMANAPKELRKVNVGDHVYFYVDGRFYQKTPTAYVVVTGPVGARIKALPEAAVEVRIGPVTYRHYYGTYYRWDQREQAYEVVEVPQDEPVTQSTIIFTDGTAMSGIYLGGNEESIDFLADDEVYEILVSDITSITFHPPPGEGG